MVILELIHVPKLRALAARSTFIRPRPMAAARSSIVVVTLDN